MHLIRFFQEIQSGYITPDQAHSYLHEHGEKLQAEGESYYYEVRERFNQHPNSLDFLFLNRSCYNGVIRFNQKGYFNVPFCRKPARFSSAYITKITNQIRHFEKILLELDWSFLALDFRKILAAAQPGDLIYVDPPYAGRHVDYYTSWSDQEEADLGTLLKRLPCRFILSTWHSNQFRKNDLIERHWSGSRFYIRTKTHFYHVGPTETLRHPMIEALVTNFAW